MSSSKPYNDKQSQEAVGELWRALMPMPEPGSAETDGPHTFSGASELHALVVVSVLRIAGEIKLRMDNFVRPFDLTTSRMGVLLTLHFSPEKLSPSDLGERLFVTRGNMTGLIQGLVNDGLVKRVQREGDRRAHDLELTEHGVAVLTEYLPHHRHALARLTAGLTPDEAFQLAKLLGKVRAGMQTPEPPTR